jgi:hypothetical protein
MLLERRVCQCKVQDACAGELYQYQYLVVPDDILNPKPRAFCAIYGTTVCSTTFPSLSHYSLLTAGIR